MHDLDRNLLFTQFIYLVDYGLAYMSLLFFRKLCQCTVCALAYCIDDLLYIKIFQAAILLDHLNDLFRSVFHTIILITDSV